MPLIDDVQAVTTASLVRAMQIRDACCREPHHFEPVPSRPLFVDQEKTYHLADNKHVRADLAVIRAFADKGRDYAYAVTFRLMCVMQMIADFEDHARKLGLIRGEGRIQEVSEAIFTAAAEIPCSRKKGFNRRRFFARAQKAMAEASA